MLNNKHKINSDRLVCMCGEHFPNYYNSIILIRTENNLNENNSLGRRWLKFLNDDFKSPTKCYYNDRNSVDIL